MYLECLEALTPGWADFTYHIDVSSKTKDIRKVISQSSKTEWAEFEETIAKILNIFTPNLRAQYILSTEPTGTIPIALTSQSDLDELYTRLVPLVVPPRNANGSKSKRKMKEVTVKITDKSEDANTIPSVNSNGKVCDKHCFRSHTQDIFLQKKNENHELSSSTGPFNDIYQKRIAVREALRARWRCEMHTVGYRPVPCWQDGITAQCYAMTENDLNLWADLHVHCLNILRLCLQ